MPLNKVNKINKPNLRFPEFNNDYIKTTLKEISILTMGKDIFGRKEMDNLVGSVDCIHYGDLNTSLNIINNSSFPKTNFEGKVFSKNNDLLISLVLPGNNNTFKWVSIKKNGILLSHSISIFNINVEFDSDYISLVLNSKKYTKKIQTLVQGTIASRLSPNNLKKLEFTISSNKNEQNKIVYFYKQLLILIEKNEKLIEKLKIKNNLLIELLLSNSLKNNETFEPFYRFKNFYTGFNKINLGEVSVVSRVKIKFDKKEIDNINGINECIQYSDINNHLLPVNNTIFSKTNLNNGYISDKNWLIISESKSGNTGTFKWVSIQKKGIMLFRDINIFKINNSINSDYLSLLLNRKHYQSKVFRLIKGSIATHIYPKDLINLPFFITTDKNEQNKIVDFYILLEKRIEAERQNLIQTKELLKFLSNNMF